MKYWEIIADNLSKAGWSWGCVATVDSSGRTIFVADAHRDNGKRLVVRADEKLTAFLELERVTRESRTRLFDRSTSERFPPQSSTWGLLFLTSPCPHSTTRVLEEQP
jgi:hypothetical protein